MTDDQTTQTNEHVKLHLHVLAEPRRLRRLALTTHNREIRASLDAAALMIETQAQEIRQHIKERKTNGYRDNG